MIAVVIKEPGGPEVLEVQEVADPSPSAGEVLLDVHATALNRADLLQRRGFYPPPKGASEILGLECAGTVAGHGEGVAEPPVGSRVMALLAGGGYAERVVVPREHLMAIPDGLSFEDAAAVPEAFLTAQEALCSLGKTEAGETVLIHAAAGGVGSAAVQVAKLLGAHVIATAGSDDKLKHVDALGADVCVNYREQDFAAVVREVTHKRGADVIVDFIAGSHAEKHLACLAPGGRWVVVGLLGGTSASVDFARVLMRRLQILGLVMRSRSREDKAAITRRFCREFLGHFRSGRLKPVVDRCFELHDVKSAHEFMEENANVGKLVLTLR